jgi:hypothetical protein
VRKSVNPGSLLEVHGSFELAVSLAAVGERPLGEGGVLREQLVRDRESGLEVGLADLLRAFLEDPDEKVTGPIRIRIEADR